VNYYHLTGQTNEAYNNLRAAYSRSRGTAHAILIAMMAEDRGDQATADEYYRRARTATYADSKAADGRLHLIGQRVHTGRLLELIQSTPKDQVPDAAKIEEIIMDAPTVGRRSSLYYFASKLTGRRGHTDVSLAYLREAAAGQRYGVYVIFARHDLRLMEVPIEAESDSQ
jgi:hypothetical protein